MFVVCSISFKTHIVLLLRRSDTVKEASFIKDPVKVIIFIACKLKVFSRFGVAEYLICFYRTNVKISSVKGVHYQVKL